VASAFRAQAQETDRVVCEAQGDLPTVFQPARKQGDRTDQPDLAGVGELLCSGALEPVFLDGQRLGGKEGPAALDACAEAPRIWLEEVE